MKVEIVRLNHNGDGIGYVDGKVVFVPKTVPGDIVWIDTLKEHKNFSIANTFHYETYSSLRQEDICCPYFERCGGCQLMALSYSEQLEYKKNKVIDILYKYAKIAVNVDICSGASYHYRNKIILQVKEGIIGLFEFGSNQLVPIHECLLGTKKMNGLIHTIQNNIDLIGVKKIMIRETLTEVMVQFQGVVLKEKVVEVLASFVDSIYLNDELVYGKKYLVEQLGKYSFCISPASFFQVNHDMMIQLYDCVKKYLGNMNGNVLDLYCGTGSIGIYVSDCCKRITGIEVNHSSVLDAQRNILLNQLSNIEVKEGDVGKLLEGKNTYDAIIIDPPRSGLDKRTRAILKRIKSSKVIYVSCNPITLARDLEELMEFYEVEDITLFDMFPNTYHVECVMWMSLKK